MQQLKRVRMNEVLQSGVDRGLDAPGLIFRSYADQNDSTVIMICAENQFTPSTVDNTAVAFK